MGRHSLMMRDGALSPQMARLARDPVFVSMVETLATLAPELGKPAALVARLLDLGPGGCSALAESSGSAVASAVTPAPSPERTRREGLQLLRIPEAAKLLGVHPNTVKTMIKHGSLPSVKISKAAIGISLAAIETYLTGHTSFARPLGEA